MAVYAQSAKALRGEADYLSGATSADWYERVTLSSQSIGAHVDEYQNLVMGKTGNRDAEVQLSRAWAALAQKTASMAARGPSALEVAAAQAAQILSDFVGGVKAAYQSYSTWALKNAGDSLEKFHGSEQALRILKKDLSDAKASRKFSAQTISDQEVKINEAQSKLDAIRSTFQALSGGASIDDIAQQEYGTYSQLGAAHALAVSWPILVAAAVVIVAVLVAAVWIAVSTIKPLTEGAKNALDAVAQALGKPGSLSIIGLTVFGLWALPKVIEAWRKRR